MFDEKIIVIASIQYRNKSKLFIFLYDDVLYFSVVRNVKDMSNKSDDFFEYILDLKKKSQKVINQDFSTLPL